jgi:hypothetical protein
VAMNSGERPDSIYFVDAQKNTENYAAIIIPKTIIK